MTGDDVIVAFNALSVKTFPERCFSQTGVADWAVPEQIIVNGDDWRGKDIVKLADVLAIVGRIANQLDHER